MIPEVAGRKMGSYALTGTLQRLEQDIKVRVVWQFRVSTAMALMRLFYLIDRM